MHIKNNALSHTVTVTGYASGGEGVARLDNGKTVFIRGAARGDTLEVALVSERQRSAVAKIVRIIEPAPCRINPDCPYYPDCGGCDFRHISYEEELDAKLRRVNDAIARIGGSVVCADRIMTTGIIGGYRNKAVFHDSGSGHGFYRPGSREVVPVDRCLLLKDELNEALKHLPPGGETTLRSGRYGTNQPLEEELDGLVFKIKGFFQVNTGAALLLFNKAREYAALSKNDSLLDLYCGVGALTLFIGRDAGYALGVEQNPLAVKTAKTNARMNGFDHIEFEGADVASFNRNGFQPDCIIVDPPRAGLSAEVVIKLAALSPQRIIYVSCDPATLARDIKFLNNYSLKDISVVDMFPRTANVECCCLLLKAE